MMPRIAPSRHFAGIGLGVMLLLLCLIPQAHPMLAATIAADATVRRINMSTMTVPQLLRFMPPTEPAAQPAGLSLPLIKDRDGRRTGGGINTTTVRPGWEFGDAVAEKVRQIQGLAEQLGESIEEYPVLEFEPGSLAAELDKLIATLEARLTTTKTREMDGKGVPLCLDFWAGRCTLRVACTKSHTRKALDEHIRRWLPSALWEHLPVPQRRDAQGAVVASTPSNLNATLALGSTVGNLGVSMNPSGSRLINTLTIADPLSCEAWEAVLESVRLQETTGVPQAVTPSSFAGSARGFFTVPAPLRALVVRKVEKAGGMRILMKAIGSSILPNLTTLDLSKCDLGIVSPKGVMRLATALGTNQTLTSLNLSYNALQSMGALAVVQALVDNPDSPLRWLNLEGNGIQPQLASVVGAAVGGGSRQGSGSWGSASANSSIRGGSAAVNAATSFSGLSTQEYQQAFTALCDGLAVLSTTMLEKLSLASNELGADGVRRFLRSFTEKSDAMNQMNTQLDVGSGSPRSREKKEGQPSMPCSTLAFLDLCNVDLHDAGVGAVAGFFLKSAASSQLLYLNLGWNKISTDGAVTLCGALASRSTLSGSPGSSTSIMDSRSGGGGSGNPSGSPSATFPPLQLQALKLHQNTSIGRKGVVSLAELLKVNVSLTSVDLRWTSASEEGVTSLGEALLTNRVVRELHLGNNDVDPRLIEVMIAEKIRKRNTAAAAAPTPSSKEGHGSAASGPAWTVHPAAFLW